MRKRETSTEIDGEAARWVARLDHGPLSDEEEARLRGWLALDVRRVGAFARARATMARTEVARALGSGYNPADFLVSVPPSGSVGRIEPVSRRRLLWLGGGAVACGLAAISTQLSARPRYQTKRGEMLRVDLEDGTIVNLNTMSAIEVDYSQRHRTVWMENGEALFQVAKDSRRPFVVVTGETMLEAVGTEFSVRRDPGSAVCVVVQEGVVEIGKKHSGQKPVQLTQNMRAETLSGGAAVIQLSLLDADTVQRDLYWRKGKIAFSGTTLAEAAAEFGRYNERHIRIPDPEVGKRTIVGLFNTRNPEGFATAVAGILGLEVTIDGNAIILAVPSKAHPAQSMAT